VKLLLSVKSFVEAKVSMTRWARVDLDQAVIEVHIWQLGTYTTKVVVFLLVKFLFLFVLLFFLWFGSYGGG